MAGEELDSARNPESVLPFRGNNVLPNQQVVVLDV